MRQMSARGMIAGVVLLLGATAVAAQPSPGDLSGYLPAGGEVSGWKPDGAPQTYRGEALFRMINGGADIYHEYGFNQVVRAAYVNAGGQSVNLEIYQMKSPASAYGIYSFKAGEGGTPLTIGQEARLQDYYLNFWKGDLLVTVIGLDSDAETRQGVVDLAAAVDTRISDTGKRPDLADRLLDEPVGLAEAKYVRGPLGVMGSYVFDTGDIFRVREGMIGTVDDCLALVFRYPDAAAGAEAYASATARLGSSARFTDGVRQGNRYSMLDRERSSVQITQAGPYIGIVVGKNQGRVAAVSERLVKRLNSD